MSAAPEPSPQPGGHMTIWEHLAELRSRLIKCIIAVALGAIIGWFVFPWVFEQLLVPFRELVPAGEGEIISGSPLQPFTTRLKVSGYLGIAFAMPVLIWQLWRFVTPGLYPHEKKYALPFTVSAMVLFLCGASIAYLTLNPALEFLISVGGQDIAAYYTVDSYVMLVVWMMLAFGLGFEFPVLIVALELIGVVKPRQLVGWWRQALVIITIAAAVITPSGDPISMLALGIPMVVLYFLAIGVGAGVLALRRRKERRTEGASTS
jgi:sec-independent protein translocase protein TatC